MPYMQFLFVRPRLCPQGYFSTPTSDFLQIPPHDGHPCLRLTVPTAKSVADFHRQVVTRAKRTYKADTEYDFRIGFFYAEISTDLLRKINHNKIVKASYTR